MVRYRGSAPSVDGWGAGGGGGDVEPVAAEVLAAWSFEAEVRAEPTDGGLINQSFWLRAPDGRGVAVLQRLNTRIFRPEVHEDIEAVTAHLAAKGLQTPRLLRTRAGRLWHAAADGSVWRCLSPVGDRTVAKLTDPADARSAGELVARFHRAVLDLRWDFRMVRPGAHDTPRHVRRLLDAVATHRDHRLWAEVAPLADELSSAWRAWRGPTGLPRRVVHGDLKISNVRFAGPAAVALVDLDTFAWGTLDEELGDAFRSWCNPLAEDTRAATFDLDLFAASIEGYARGAGADGLTDAEWEGIVPGIERICLELACRFAQDALAESYFGWNPAFGGRGEHNLLRARGQASLAASVRARSAEARRQVAAVRPR